MTTLKTIEVVIGKIKIKFSFLTKKSPGKKGYLGKKLINNPLNIKIKPIKINIFPILMQL